jgi:hypothetical protein
MSQLVIRRLLEQHANNVGGTFATAFENSPMPAVAPSTPSQEYFLLPGKTQNPTLGDGFKREVGIFQINQKFPKGTGAQAATDRAEIFRTGFKRGTTLSQGNVRVLIPEDPSLAQGVNDGQWFKVPLSVPYQADIN